MIQKKSAGRYQTVSQKKIMEDILVSANRWPSFSAFWFASRSSIVFENEKISTKVIFVPIGHIRHNTVGKK